MSAYLVYNESTYKKRDKEVRNLGWLRRNHTCVYKLELIDTTNPLYEAVLVAHLNHDKYSKYVAYFASYEILKEWVHRPIFLGIEKVDNVKSLLC